MTSMAITVLVAVAALVFFLARRKPSPPPGRQAAQPRQRQRQRAPAAQTAPPAAFALAPGRKACDAAKRLTHRRFPPADAPKLPLPTCDTERCDCVLHPLEDERKGQNEDDRRLGVGLQSELYLTTGNRERRRARGRRKTDRSR